MATCLFSIEEEKAKELFQLFLVSTIKSKKRFPFILLFIHREGTLPRHDGSAGQRLGIMAVTQWSSKIVISFASQLFLFKGFVATQEIINIIDVHFGVFL